MYKESKLLKVFAFRLTEARVKAMLSQGDLASLVGLSRTSICNMECGRQDTTISTIENLAIALRVNPEQLLKKPKRGSKVPVLLPKVWIRKYK